MSVAEDKQFFMKKIIFEKFKIVNIILFVLAFVGHAVMYINYNRWFQSADIDYIYRVFDGVYHPVMVSLKWLAGILGVLLFVPSQIFRRWLFYIAPFFLLITFYFVQGISVYSGNLLNPTRAKMAENGMIVLAVVTFIFVAGSLVQIYRARKSK